MRNIRAKKLKNETSKYLLGPFDQSLIQIQLDKNEKCIQQLSKDNFDKANQLLKQIKSDTEMISSYNRQKYIVKSLSLNTQAYFHLKQRKYQQALKCLEEAQQLEKEQQSSPIDVARTKLNKSVILSHLGKHEKAIQIGKQALQLLKQRKQMQFFELRKNQYKLYEIMIISFYNIAVELSHLSEQIEATKVYKQGYYLAQKALGPHHKLTLLLKNIVKKQKDLSRSRQKLENGSLVGNKSDNKLLQSALQTFLIPFNQKQRQLKRIYASKKKSNTIGATKVKDKDSKVQLDYYLKSLQKIKGMYRNSKRKSRGDHLYTTNRESQDQNFSQVRQARKLVTQSENSGYRHSLENHQRIKDIILNGKPVNKNGFFLNSIPEIKERKSSAKNIQKKLITIKRNEQPVALQPIVPPKQAPKELGLPEIAKKVEQKRQKEPESCQLI